MKRSRHANDDHNERQRSRRRTRRNWMSSDEDEEEEKKVDERLAPRSRKRNRDIDAMLNDFSAMNINKRSAYYNEDDDGDSSSSSGDTSSDSEYYSTSDEEDDPTMSCWNRLSMFHHDIYESQIVDRNGRPSALLLRDYLNKLLRERGNAPVETTNVMYNCRRLMGEL
jgi:hypothetical protein